MPCNTTRFCGSAGFKWIAFSICGLFSSLDTGKAQSNFTVLGFSHGQRNCGQCCRGLSGQVGSGLFFWNFIRRSLPPHVFRPSPEFVIHLRIPDLQNNRIPFLQNCFRCNFIQFFSEVYECLSVKKCSSALALMPMSWGQHTLRGSKMYPPILITVDTLEKGRYLLILIKTQSLYCSRLQKTSVVRR